MKYYLKIHYWIKICEGTIIIIIIIQTIWYIFFQTRKMVFEAKGKEWKTCE